MRDTLGHYRIVSKLGEGGMGVVYAAEDTRLGRSVALKTVRAELAGSESRERLRREARAAASLNHPNICQLYEIGEDNGELYIAMELLEGEPLSARLERGPLPVRVAVKIAVDVLAALAAVHRRDILHRDLKPSNIFLTEHGAKLLDFGVARMTEDDVQRTMPSLTVAGTVLGTPRYMAPEHASGEPLDARSDLFSVGAILYEMLAGRPAFEGDTIVRVLRGVLTEQPPVLTGSPTITAVDRVVHRALAKQPSGRHASAEVFSLELAAAFVDSTPTSEVVQARPISRLIVLPFRLLRADPEVEFLSFSLADAVTTSLSTLGSLVVRSSLTAARFGTDPDMERIAREADVDVVLSGTLLRAGQEMRLSAQLAEAPGGAILWSQAMQVSFEDIFQLHDRLVQKLIDALAISLTAREHRLLGRDVPATAKAYEFYLRANQVAKESSTLDAAVDLYKQCLEQDARYAPAWARLGYAYRLMSKYRREGSAANGDRALEALNRALAINPDLSFAHKVMAQIDVDRGDAREAMTRLLRQARHMTGDPELYAALCHTCRYCGLLEASLAAHEHATRLDPKAPTSVAHTWFLLRKFERVLEGGLQGVPYIAAVSLIELGRIDDARALIQELDAQAAPRLRDFLSGARALIGGPEPHVLQRMRGIVDQFPDPEGLYYASRTLARLGDLDPAISGIARAVESGYSCFTAFTTDPWLEPLRGNDRFDASMERARTQHEAAVAAFREADGERIVGGGSRAQVN